VLGVLIRDAGLRDAVAMGTTRYEGASGGETAASREPSVALFKWCRRTGARHSSICDTTSASRAPRLTSVSRVWSIPLVNTSPRSVPSSRTSPRTAYLASVTSRAEVQTSCSTARGSRSAENRRPMSMSAVRRCSAAARFCTLSLNF
jgi:hypothetical protein